jgi:hypothetical protein
MRDHEIELISALVEGRLEDDSEARALIASSVELQTEYEAQKKAHEALAAAGPTFMRDDERAALHRDVWTALRAETRRSRTPWYYRWVPITAGLFVVVILGAVILGGQQESGEIEMTGAAADAAATTMAASTGTTVASVERATEEAMTGAPEATSPGAEGSGSDVDQLDTRLFADANRAFRREGADLALAPASSAETAIELDECLGKADVQDVDVIGIVDSASLADMSGISVPDDISKTFIVAVPAGDDVDTASFIFFVDSEACQLVYAGE